MKKHVIIINGYDKNLVNVFRGLTGSVVSVAKASSEDAIASSDYIFGKGYPNKNAPSQYLSDLIDYLTTSHSDIVMRHLKRCVDVFKANPELDLLFLSIDDPVDIDRAEREFDAVSIFIDTPHVGGGNHYNYNIVIKNNGNYEDLKWQVCQFLLMLVAKDNFKGDALNNALTIIKRGLA